MTRCFGFHPNGTIKPDEAEVLAEVARRYLSGESLHSLVRDLNERGVRTSAGGPFRKDPLKRLLMSDRLAGPIVTDREFAAITERLTDPERRTTVSDTSATGRRYLLTGGLARCGLCGAALVSQPANSGRRAYVCPRPSLGGCGRIRIAADGLENAVTVQTLARLASPHVRRQISPTQAELAAIPLRIEDTKQALSELRQDLSSRRLGAAEARSVRRRLDTAIEALRELEQVQEQNSRAAALMEVGPDELAEWWGHTSIACRREAVAIVLDHLLVHPRTLPRGSNAFDAGRVRYIWRTA